MDINILKTTSVLVLGTCIGLAGAQVFTPADSRLERSDTRENESIKMVESGKTKVEDSSPFMVVDTLTPAPDNLNSTADPERFQDQPPGIPAFNFADLSMLTDRLNILQKINVDEYSKHAIGLLNERHLTPSQSAYYLDVYVDAFFLRWVKVDSEAVIAFIQDYPDLQRLHVISKIVESHSLELVAIDPVGAVRWANSIYGEKAKQSALANIALRWLEDDEEALNYYLQSNLIYPLDDNSPSLTMVEAVLDSLAEYDPSAALAWLNRLRNPALSSQKRSVIENWIIQQPVAALDWLTNLPSDELHAQLPQLLPTIAQSQPTAAIELFTHLSPTDQGMMVGHVANGLFLVDEALAENWVSNLLEPALQNLGAASLSEMKTITKLRDNPEQVLDDLQYLQGESRRDNLLSVVSKVAISHRSVAENWLTYATISDDERMILEALLKEIPH